MQTLSEELSERVFEVVTAEGVEDLLDQIGDEVSVSWLPVGAIENNVHTVEVSSDPALALMERPINGIDALLDLRARERRETAPTPHIAAERWFGVPSGGLTELDQNERRELAEMLQVTMLESGVPAQPTILIQDQGTGQHPEDFPSTLLSLLASNKKEQSHVMGVYNAGGAASYRFARYVIIASRLAPVLLEGRSDEIGMSIIRYNPLDPERFKSGTYEYLAAGDGSILRLSPPELPGLSYGTYVKLIQYELSRYARAASEPKQSLWHLFHAGLPDPALPMRVIETRTERFPGLQGKVSRRVISGLLHLLGRPGTADYSDIRTLQLGPDLGTVVVRYYVLNEETDPDAYTSTKQGLTITLNGQRQITRDRAWVKRNLDLPFLYKRLVIVVDGTGLTSAAKRSVFSSTRETGVDSPEARKIIERVVVELGDDENLHQLDEEAKQRVVENAQKTTTEKVKRQLARQITAYLKGDMVGSKGGGRQKRRRRRPRPNPGPAPIVDDSLMPDVPDSLEIENDPVRIERGATASLKLGINAKNDFLPRYSDGLSVVLGADIGSFVKMVASGRLLGGTVRVTLQADQECPIAASTIRAALVVPELGVLLTASGAIQVVEPRSPRNPKSPSGGEPDIDVNWLKRDSWTDFEPAWDEYTVGKCQVHREDPLQPVAITKVEWYMNEDFAPYRDVIEQKDLDDLGLQRFREAFEYPVLFGLFKQALAEEEKEQEADEEGRQIEIPDDYVRGEQSRMARAVLMAMEPEIQVAEMQAREPVQGD
jgi:hypothetical protein